MLGASGKVMFPAPGPQLMIQQVQHWQSPYPPPEHIKEYEAILPGTFDRIIKMAEEAQRAQIDSTRRAQDNIDLAPHNSHRPAHGRARKL